MFEQGYPRPELCLAAEMLRILARGAHSQAFAIRTPALATELLRDSADKFAAKYEFKPDYQMLLRRAESIANFIYFSAWFGEKIDPIELEDGRLIYHLRVGHCGCTGCCGPEPVLGISDDLEHD